MEQIRSGSKFGAGAIRSGSNSEIPSSKSRENPQKVDKFSIVGSPVLDRAELGLQPLQENLN